MATKVFIAFWKVQDIIRGCAKDEAKDEIDIDRIFANTFL